MTIEDINKKDCCGCSLCSTVCTKKCISMQPDEEGFLIPTINRNECNNCGLCYKKCPVNKEYKTKKTPRYFASAISDKKELMNSSSGGTFIALAKHILSQNGYVCGCVFNNEMKAVHICSNRIEDIHRMMGSKYVQSSLENALPDLKRLIKEGKKILFTGTACQVAALKSLFPNEENLFLIDILCHGVPSPLFFHKYIDFLEKKHKGKIINIEFRNKKKLGWGSEHRTYYEIERNGKIKGYRPILPAYFCSFFYGTNLRESCYRCKYAGNNRISDITIGDFWGYMEYYGHKFPEGISISSINSEKGIEIFSPIKKHMSFCDEIPSDKGKGTNTNFYHPTIRISSRDHFYDNITNKKYKDFIWPIYLEKATRHKFIISLYGRFMPQWLKNLRNMIK